MRELAILTVLILAGPAMAQPKPPSPGAAGAQPGSAVAKPGSPEELLGRIQKELDRPVRESKTGEDIFDRQIETRKIIIRLADDFERKFPLDLQLRWVQQQRLKAYYTLARTGDADSAKKALAEIAALRKGEFVPIYEPELDYYELLLRDVLPREREEGSRAALAACRKFVQKHPRHPYSAEILYGAARIAQEAGYEKDRLDFLARLAAGFPDSKYAPAARVEMQRAQRVGNPVIFEFTDLAGRKHTLAEFKGKPVLVVFWATWSIQCIEDLPRLKGLYDRYHPQGLEIVSISLDDDRRKLEDELKKRALPWPAAFSGKGWFDPVAREWGVDGLPAMLLVDRKGNLQAIDPAPLEPAIKEAISK